MLNLNHLPKLENSRTFSGQDRNFQNFTPPFGSTLRGRGSFSPLNLTFLKNHPVLIGVSLTLIFVTFGLVLPHSSNFSNEASSQPDESETGLNNTPVLTPLSSTGYFTASSLNRIYLINHSDPKISMVQSYSKPYKLYNRHDVPYMIYNTVLNQLEVFGEQKRYQAPLNFNHSMLVNDDSEVELGKIWKTGRSKFHDGRAFACVEFTEEFGILLVGGSRLEFGVALKQVLVQNGRKDFPDLKFPFFSGSSTIIDRQLVVAGGSFGSEFGQVTDMVQSIDLDQGWETS